MDINKITPENYKVPKGEERSYHCIIECMQYDQKDGKKISVPRIQKFGRKMFEAHIYSSLKKQGYNVIILHDPKEWIKNQEQIAKQKAEEKAKAEKEARDAAFQKAVKEEVARQLASVKTEPSKAGRPKKQ